jgi:hypothetical protein
MKEDPNINQLLNSYIDGELAERQRTEVQRLVARDAQVAQQLRELQKCKILVSSLPRAEAPGRMLERIKISLESRTITAPQPSGSERRRGAKHLLIRKVLTAAAMVGLVAVLGTVVYTIVSPEKAAGPLVAFSGRLELKTSDPAAVDAVISQAVDNSGISLRTGTQDGNKVYTLTGSREAITAMLTADLNSVWDSFDSKEFAIKDKPVVVDSAEEVVNLMTPPKPRLTKDEKIEPKPADLPTEQKKVRLTIVIANSE